MSIDEVSCFLSLRYLATIARDQQRNSLVWETLIIQGEIDSYRTSTERCQRDAINNNVSVLGGENSSRALEVLLLGKSNPAVQDCLAQNPQRTRQLNSNQPFLEAKLDPRDGRE